MDKYLKMLTVFLSIFIILTPASVSAFYIDMPEDNQYEKAIIHMAIMCPDLFKGGYFYPDREVRRDEFLKILFCEDKNEGTGIYANTVIPFTDVDKEADYINELKIALFWEAIKGFEDNTFKPWASITNLEALKILISLKQNTDKAMKGMYLSNPTISKNGDWVEEVLSYVKKRNIIDNIEDKKYTKITRKDFAQILYRFDVLSVLSKDVYENSLDDEVDYLTFFTDKSRKENLKEFKSISQIVDEYYLYPEELKDPYLYNEANKAIVNNLSDPYTNSYTPEEFSYDKVAYDQVDLGFSIKFKEYKDYGYIYVSDIDRKSIAYKKGLRKRNIINNIILTPNGITEENDLEGDFQMLFVDYQTSKTSKKSKNFQVPIKIVDTNNLNTTFLDNDIAYMRLHIFDGTAIPDLEKEMKKMGKNKNVSGYVLDLRSNPGGQIDVLMKLSEYIFPADTTIFKSVDKTGKIMNIRTKRGKGNSIWNKDVPWVVLIDGMSASASEVMTNALIDLKKDVTIIGLPSFGKGEMQITFQSKNTVYAITTGEMRSPKGRIVNTISIEPDILLNIGDVFPYFDKSKDILGISK